MTQPVDSSINARVQAVVADFQARQRKLFITFAMVEGPVLIVLAVLIFGLEVIDPDVGVWIIFGVALIGGAAMSMLLVRQIQQRNVAIAQAKGENPLF